MVLLPILLLLLGAFRGARANSNGAPDPDTCLNQFANHGYIPQTGNGGFFVSFPDGQTYYTPGSLIRVQLTVTLTGWRGIEIGAFLKGQENTGLYQGDWVQWTASIVKPLCGNEGFSQDNAPYPALTHIDANYKGPFILGTWQAPFEVGRGTVSFSTTVVVDTATFYFADFLTLPESTGNYQLLFVDGITSMLQRGTLTVKAGPSGVNGPCPSDQVDGVSNLVVENQVTSSCGTQPALAFGGTMDAPTINIGTVLASTPTITLGSSDLVIHGLASVATNGSSAPLVIDAATGLVFQGNSTAAIAFASGQVDIALSSSSPFYFLSAGGKSSPVSTTSYTTTSTQAFLGTQSSWTCPAAGTISKLQLTATVTGLSANASSLSLDWTMLRGADPGNTPVTPLAPLTVLGTIGNACANWIVTGAMAGTTYTASCYDTFGSGICNSGDRIVVQTNGNVTASGPVSFSIAMSGTAAFTF